MCKRKFKFKAATDQSAYSGNNAAIGVGGLGFDSESLNRSQCRQRFATAATFFFQSSKLCGPGIWPRRRASLLVTRIGVIPREV